MRTVIPCYNSGMESTEKLTKLGFGWTIDYRPHEAKWPAPYRVRILPNKNERSDFRVEVWAHTTDGAVDAAIEQAGRLYAPIQLTAPPAASAPRP